MQLRVRFWVTLLVLSAVPSVASADNPIARCWQLADLDHFFRC